MTPDDAAPPTRGGVQAADTVLAVLEAIAWSPEPLGVTQVAAAVGVAKSAAFRHLRTLLDRGYLLQDPATSRFRLGPKLSLLGRLAPPEADLATTIQPALREARDASELSVVVSTPTPRGALVVATLAGTRAIDIGVRVGSSLSLHASAQGKVLLAFGPAAWLERVLTAPRPRLTPRTITGAAELAAEVARVRVRGHALAPEESLLGVNALAAPVRDARGVLVAAVALVGSIQHLPAGADERLLRILAVLAARASRLVAGLEADPTRATDAPSRP